MEADHFSGIGCFKRIKTRMLEHVESVRGTVFTEATRKTGSAVQTTVDELASAVKRKVGETVELIDSGYSALLVDGSIFKELATARDELRDLLSQVDGRFAEVLGTPSEPPPSGPVDGMAAMRIHDGPSTIARESPAQASTSDTQAAVAVAANRESFALMTCGGSGASDAKPCEGTSAEASATGPGTADAPTSTGLESSIAMAVEVCTAHNQGEPSSPARLDEDAPMRDEPVPFTPNNKG
jgi:hypothetical protein